MRLTPYPLAPHARGITRCRGLSLVELIIAIALLAVLATLAWPSLLSPIRQERRADAREAAAIVMQAQEDWRSRSNGYTDDMVALRLQDTLPPVLGNAWSRSRAGHYHLRVRQAHREGYVLDLQAQGAQARDTACLHMQLQVHGGQVDRLSGPTTDLGNGSAINRRCWGQ